MTGSTDEGPRIGDVALEVGREHHGRSLFDLLDARFGPLDRRAVRDAGRRARILLNGEPVGPAVTLRTGDAISLLEPVEDWSRAADPSQLPVLARLDDVIVGVKPSGLHFDVARHGSRPCALSLLPTGEARARPVHRLDKDTSGIVVAAIGRDAETRLVAAFQDGTARMHYFAVVRGRPRDDTGVIDLALHHKSRSSAILVPDPVHGRPCRTAWHIVEEFRSFTALELIPEAGRSHQVRAHLASLGHPALCDAAYGEDDRLLLSQLKLDYRAKRGRPERPLLQRPALHAARFVWDGHLDVEAELPDDLSVLLNQLRRHRPSV